ncbi:uncharacterized protein Z518_00102 [Rhinocladiella mackenziei CBS 650.93]|uniref:RGS domain-containing protein n=1 Tax=Rhinocladiella mackenziei CBS 650.93 TaxID=1442369 RepID=A0A0D2ISU2_9EURO|nr:uncharacterized protein Z518_00102 [Rhinocladiella mackenziei CBS 650.93]KIX09024.1 hypothetical protein Z518_00102 [Rhinocladiella mackenziei CBS 650.93]
MKTFHKATSWLNWYKKPSYRDVKIFTQSTNDIVDKGQRPPSISSQSDSTIPSSLTLDRVLANKTCSPLSLYDFYMYLKHIEMSQENLEFYMWYQDYESRVRATPKSVTPSQSTTPLLPQDEKSCAIPNYTKILSGDVPDLEQGSQETEFVQYIETLLPGQDIKSCRRCWSVWPMSSQTSENAPARTHTNKEELQIITNLFLAPNSAKELNLPSSMRKEALAAIAKSESPASLAPVADHIYYLLKNCSHRNFIRLGVKNGTFETLCMVTIVGVLFNVLGLLTMLLIAFASPSIHHSSRWRGLAAAPFWIIGFSFLLAGIRGSCFLLLLFSRRQELPWERVEENEKTPTQKAAHALKRFLSRLMIFEHKIRVKDEGLRNLQHKIVIQSVVGAIVATAILEVVFLVLPVWK